MSARSLATIGVVVIAFALLAWVISRMIHGASFAVLIIALIAGLACVVLGIERRSRG